MTLRDVLEALVIVGTGLLIGYIVVCAMTPPRPSRDRR